MDVLMEIDSAIRVGVSGDSVYLTRKQLIEYYKKIHEELSNASVIWWLMDLQDFDAVCDSYQSVYVKVHELSGLIKDLNLKLGA
jgi:hypothetical protein